MNKTELVEAIAKEAGFTKKDITTAIEAMTTVITNELENGGEVKLTGIGTFYVTETAARQGHNPATMEPITIEAKKNVRFKASSTLKNALNE